MALARNRNLHHFPNRFRSGPPLAFPWVAKVVEEWVLRLHPPVPGSRLQKHKYAHEEMKVGEMYSIVSLYTFDNTFDTYRFHNLPCLCPEWHQYQSSSVWLLVGQANQSALHPTLHFA